MILKCQAAVVARTGRALLVAAGVAGAANADVAYNLVITPGTGTNLDCDYARSIAYAVGIGPVPQCGCMDCAGSSDGWVDVDTVGNCSTYANAESHPGDCQPPVSSAATATTWGFGITLLTSASVQLCSSCVGNGVIAAVAHGDLSFTADGAWEWTGSIAVVGGLVRSDGGEGRIIRVVLDEEPGSPIPPEYVIQALEGFESSGGLTYNSSSGDWEGSPTGTGSAGSFSFEIIAFEFEDDAMDVLGDDGRFSQADIDALAGVVGTGSATDASYTDHWDFDSNGEIEQYDVDFMQRLVDLGLGSGLLGDYNRDEVVDCDDFHAMGSGWNYTIGDANYRVEIDADLDGDNDSTDYDTIYELLQPADVNNDGSVNTQDFSAFLSLYNAQDPAADVNGDGSVNTQDYILFLNLWNNPC